MFLEARSAIGCLLADHQLTKHEHDIGEFYNALERRARHEPAARALYLECRDELLRTEIDLPCMLDAVIMHHGLPRTMIGHERLRVALHCLAAYLLPLGASPLVTDNPALARLGRRWPLNEVLAVALEQPRDGD